MAKGKYQRWLEPDGLILLRNWARAGLTDAQIADKMDISAMTLYRWKNEHRQICQALKKGAEVYNSETIDSLHKHTLGFMVQETTVTRDADGNVLQTVTKDRYIPGNVTAMIFWLKNRLPKDWKDKPTDDADEEQLQKLRQLLGGIPSAF